MCVVGKENGKAAGRNGGQARNDEQGEGLDYDQLRL
jgi:hypothetical protein